MDRTLILNNINKKEKEEQNWKSDEWLLRQLQKHRINDRIYEFLVGIKPILNQIYNDNYDIWLNFVLEERRIKITSFNLVIHFPEITVTNDTDSIDIKNLFVSFLFYERNASTLSLDPTMKGLRTSCTYLEYINNYQHSHLPSSTYQREMGKF